MKIVALAAALSMAISPTLVMADGACPPNEVRTADDRCVCAGNLIRDAEGVCVPPPGDTAQNPPVVPPGLGFDPKYLIPVALIIPGIIACVAFCGGDDNKIVPTPSTN